jgi:hypothetical protein
MVIDDFIFSGDKLDEGSGAKKDKTYRQICPPSCEIHKGCEACTNAGCMWCASQGVCVGSNAYVATFPYGQCLEWTTQISKCSGKPQLPCYQDVRVERQHGGKYTPSQDSTRINHCYDSANSGCFVKRGRCDRRCTQHTKIPSGSSLTSDTYE